MLDLSEVEVDEVWEDEDCHTTTVYYGVPIDWLNHFGIPVPDHTVGAEISIQVDRDWNPIFPAELSPTVSANGVYFSDVDWNDIDLGDDVISKLLALAM